MFKTIIVLASTVFLLGACGNVGGTFLGGSGGLAGTGLGASVGDVCIGKASEGGSFRGVLGRDSEGGLACQPGGASEL